tara:strand:- start:285 stop:998 length:714 start_codon:yes stop_codon:yes gene_type:complete
VLAASFTGCLADDTSDSIEQEENTEETIEPVGTDNNETEDYDELISKIANLTNQIENLNEQINILSEDLQSLESYRYNPPENSSKVLSGWSCRWVGGPENNTSIQECGFFEVVEIIKEGNKITIIYLGERADTYPNNEDTYGPNATANCTSQGLPITFMNAEGTTIGNYPYSQGRYFRSDSSWEVKNECDLLDFDDIYEDYWSSMSIILPEEPVRVYYNGVMLSPTTGIIDSTFTFD